MKNQKMYEPDDKLINIIRDNYNVLQSLGSFGINLGFGDKTVKEVCEDQSVDTYTFLAVVNFTINGYRDSDDAQRLSIPTLIHYLKASHYHTISIFSCPPSARSWRAPSTRTTTWRVSSSASTTSMPTTSSGTCSMKRRRCFRMSSPWSAASLHSTTT